MPSDFPSAAYDAWRLESPPEGEREICAECRLEIEVGFSAVEFSPGCYYCEYCADANLTRARCGHYGHSENGCCDDCAAGMEMANDERMGR